MSLSQEHEINALEYQALATATYVLDMMFIKLSIGIFLLRIATQKRYRYTIWASIVIVAIWSLVLFFWNLLQCDPISAQWDYRLLENPENHCVSPQAIVDAAYALSVMTILSDWLYALLPIPMVWNVKMTKQAKATVVLILGLGIFASIATLIRLKFLSDLSDLSDILCTSPPSPSTSQYRRRQSPTNTLQVAGTNAMVWTMIEPGVAIVASSLVTIRPLLRAWKIRGFQATENSRRTRPSLGIRGSRTNRSKGASAAGGGSRDPTLTDVELGQNMSVSKGDWGNTTHVTSRSRPSFMSRISERRDSKAEDDEAELTRYPSGTIVTRRVEISREPHDRSTAPWIDECRSSPSSLELTEMQPEHNQNDSRVGLGSSHHP